MKSIHMNSTHMRSIGMRYALCICMAWLAMAVAVAAPKGLYPVMVDERWGYIDGSGAMSLEPQYEIAGQFREGLAVVKPDGKYFGYMDISGKFVIPPKFKMANDFSDGLAVCTLLDDRVVIIDKQGRSLYRPYFEQIDKAYSEGLLVVVKDGKYGFLSRTNHLAIKPQFDEALAFSGGLAAVRAGGKWGYIDHMGKMVVAPSYDYASYFTNGFAAVRRDKKYGFIDKTGKVAIPLEFDRVTYFHGGLAGVSKGKKVGAINRNGKWMFEIKNADAIQPFSEERAAFRLRGAARLWGYVEPDGHVIIPPVYNLAMQFHNGLALASKRDEMGYIDRRGHFIWKGKRFQGNPEDPDAPQM